jgi:hypothetical protein
MAIEGPQDQHSQSEIARDFHLLSNERFGGAPEGQAGFNCDRTSRAISSTGMAFAQGVHSQRPTRRSRLTGLQGQAAGPFADCFFFVGLARALLAFGDRHIPEIAAGCPVHVQTCVCPCQSTSTVHIIVC